MLPEKEVLFTFTLPSVLFVPRPTVIVTVCSQPKRAMVVIIPTVIQDNTEQTEPGPRCSTCEQVKPDEWINWQKCWSDPYIGEDNEPRILAHPIGCSNSIVMDQSGTSVFGGS